MRTKAKSENQYLLYGLKSTRDEGIEKGGNDNVSNNVLSDSFEGTEKEDKTLVERREKWLDELEETLELTSRGDRETESSSANGNLNFKRGNDFDNKKKDGLRNDDKYELYDDEDEYYDEDEYDEEYSDDLDDEEENDDFDADEDDDNDRNDAFSVTSLSPSTSEKDKIRKSTGNIFYDMDDDFERRPIEEPFNDLGKRVGHAVLWPKMDYREFLENSAWGIGNDPYYSNLENAVENLFTNYITGKRKKGRRQKKKFKSTPESSNEREENNENIKESTANKSNKGNNTNQMAVANSEEPNKDNMNISMLQVSLEVWKKRLRKYQEEGNANSQIEEAERKIKEIRQKINNTSTED